MYMYTVYIVIYNIYIYLVGGIPTPLKKSWRSSVGIILPKIWKNKSHVPNHQPDIYIYICIHCYIYTYCIYIYIYICIASSII